MIRNVVQTNVIMHSVGTDSSGKWGVFMGKPRLELGITAVKGLMEPGMQAAGVMVGGH